jgi:hypothetical protein
MDPMDIDIDALESATVGAMLTVNVLPGTVVTLVSTVPVLEIVNPTPTLATPLSMIVAL